MHDLVGQNQVIQSTKKVGVIGFGHFLQVIDKSIRWVYDKVNNREMQVGLIDES